MNYTTVDIKNTLKQGLIYLLIAFPFILVVAVCLTIIRAPLWAVMLCNVAVGGVVIILAYIIHSKIKEKRKEKEKAKPKKFDPFKDWKLLKTF